MTTKQRIEHIDRWVAREHGDSHFDSETARLYRHYLETNADARSSPLLSSRLGRSLTNSCTRIRILGASIDDREPEDDAGEPAGDGRPPKRASLMTIKMSVAMATTADFAPLGRRLCQAGCAIDLLPYGSFDPRIQQCAWGAP
jgi:hypothetical protein